LKDENEKLKKEKEEHQMKVVETEKQITTIKKDAHQMEQKLSNETNSLRETLNEIMKNIKPAVENSMEEKTSRSDFQNNLEEPATTNQSTKENQFSWTSKRITDNLFPFGAPTEPATDSTNLAIAPEKQTMAPANIPIQVQSSFAGTSTFSFPQAPSNTNIIGTVSEVEMPTKNNLSNNTQNIPRTPKTSSIKEYGEDVEAECSFEFIPIVTLDKVTMATGEDEETTLFSEKSKIFRFDPDSKLWKERGVGMMKILLNEKTNQSRLVMRREQIYKLCANHGLVEGMSLEPIANNNKTYVWKTNADISEGEPQEILFAARFKDENLAQRFAIIFRE